MMLATTKVEDVDQFLTIFSTKGTREAEAARFEGCDCIQRS